MLGPGCKEGAVSFALAPFEMFFQEKRLVLPLKWYICIYICIKMWTLTYPRGNESVIETTSWNFFRYESIFACCYSSTLQSNSRGQYMVIFALQNNVWLALIPGLLLRGNDWEEICKLKMIRMKKSRVPTEPVFLSFPVFWTLSCFPVFLSVFHCLACFLDFL